MYGPILKVETLKKLATHRLLERFKKVRKMYNLDHDGNYPELKIEMDNIKAILDTREHHPRGKEGRKLRQKEKQNR